MKKLLVYFLHTVDKTNEGLGRVLSFLLLVLCFLMVYEVMVRYVFNNPTIWAHEVGLFMYGGIGILGGGYVLFRGHHVRLDFFYARLSPRNKAILDLVTVPFFLFALGVLLWQSGVMAYQSVIIAETTGSTWRPPYYPVKIAVPVATFLLLLQGLAKFIRDLFFVLRREQLS